MQLKLVLLALSLYANGVLAQGTLLWTWHDSGPSNLTCSATFQLSQLALQRDQSWPTNFTDEMNRTVEVTDPWGNRFSQATAEVHSIGAGNVLDWAFDIQLYDPKLGLLVDLNGHHETGYSMVTELVEGGGELLQNFGNWTRSLVPEPDATSLLLLGLVMWILNGRRGCRCGQPSAFTAKALQQRHTWRR